MAFNRSIFLLILPVLVFSLTACKPQPVIENPESIELNVSGARLLEYGLFQETREGKKHMPKTSMGYMNIVTDQYLEVQTDSVEARLKTTFGITYTIEGTPDNAEVELLIRATHPPITNPATGKPVSLEENTASTTIGRINYDSFTFEEPWELAPGPWTFQVFCGGKMLLEKTFQVRLSSPTNGTPPAGKTTHP